MRERQSCREQRPRGPPEIPIPRSSNGSVTDQLEQVMTRVAALPLEQVVEGLDGLIGAARRIVDDPALPQLLQNLARTSEALAAAAQQVEPTLDAVPRPRRTASGCRSSISASARSEPAVWAISSSI